MNWAARMALLALAVVSVSFAGTWATLPEGLPASLYASGLTARNVGVCARWSAPYQHELLGGALSAPYRDCVEYEQGDEYVRDTSTQRRRVYAVHGGAASAIVLVGLALGAGRRRHEREQ